MSKLITRTSADWLLQSVYLSVNLLIKSGLHNHAKAVSYSAVPLMLLFVYFINTYLIDYPEVGEAFNSLISFTHLNFMTHEAAPNSSFIRIPAWLSIAVILWTSRGLFRSIEGAFSVIFADPEKGRASMLLPLLIVPFGFLIISLAMLGDYVRDHVDYSALAMPMLASLLQTLLSLLSSFILAIGIWGAAFMLYYRIPRKTPKASSTLICSLLFILSALALFALLGNVMQMDLYSGLYGMLGEFIYVLIWVYLGSLLFFFWAQFLYVSGKIDLFALEKLFLERASRHQGESAIERFFFKRTERLFGKYGRHFKQGETIFSQNEDSDTVYFIYSGEVAFYQRNQGQEVPIGILHQGEIFGEMAHLLKEKRLASAVARSDCFLFVLPPQLYLEMLHGSLSFSARVIESLGQRIFRMNNAGAPVDRTQQINDLSATGRK